MRPQIKSVIYFTGEFLPNFDLKNYDFKLEKTSKFSISASQ